MLAVAVDLAWGLVLSSSNARKPLAEGACVLGGSTDLNIPAHCERCGLGAQLPDAPICTPSCVTCSAGGPIVMSSEISVVASTAGPAGAFCAFPAYSYSERPEPHPPKPIILI
jgi:hypothetical protein